jgi:hypothetical protein
MKCTFNSALLVQTLCSLLIVSSVGGRTNHWEKSTDGYWHQAHWSLGTLPSANQSISLVSPQSKSLMITAYTARERPASLQISNLFVFAPHHSQNHLVLSQVGLSNPLRVSATFNLSENALLTILNSTLVVRREFQVNSTVNQGASSRVIATAMHVGAGLTAYYNFTNGLISAPTLFVGHRSPATFHQYGGKVAATTIEVREANYFLHGGDVSADSLAVAHLYEPAVFLHHAGNVRLTNTLSVAKGNGHGRYALNSGTLTAGGLRVGGFPPSPTQRVNGAGEFTQTGGSNFPTTLVVGRYYSQQGLGSYQLSGGLLAHRGGSIGEGGFEQSGGVHEVDGQFSVHAVTGAMGAVGRGQYTLLSGRFVTHSLYINGGVFAQRGGISEVTNDLWVAAAVGTNFGYDLTGGKLVSAAVAAFKMGFRQTGGIHELHGHLYLGDSGEGVSPGYELAGGELSIGDGLYLGMGAVFRQTGGTLRQRGTIEFFAGRLEVGPGEQQLGALQLEGTTTSTIALPRAPAILRFSASAGMPWQTNGARLVIHNWAGFENGGPHQIFFGANASGLTTQQLTQLRFRNPVGYAAGDYSATILPTGEVVPVLPPRPQLTFTRARTNMIHFHFPEGSKLQAATNVAGPFTDLPALSNFPILLTNGPARFFRLRQP